MELDYRNSDLCKFLEQNADLITSPYYSTLVLELCRSAPYTLDQVQDIKDQSAAKEISRLESEALCSSFDYSVWINPDHHDRRLHPDVPPNPEMAKHIHDILVSWRKKVTSRLHFPRTSNKMIAWNSVREWSGITGQEWRIGKDGDRQEFTQITLLRFYHDTGIRVGGRCEMRQKWYRSGIAPRSYYAMGGDAFFRSSWFQWMAGELVDMLESTNHSMRLNPSRIILEDGEHLKIWDLTSFTSNHHEQRYFIEALAEFCTGYIIKLVDPYDGIVEVDMGDFLRDYNEMNILPQYSLERVVDGTEELESVHHIAGFLGVYGNLMTCTFVHGASVLQSTTNPGKLNVAGDDGHMAVTAGIDRGETTLIRANGIVEETKVYETHEDVNVCLKRPIHQIGNRIIVQQLLIWPSVSLLGEFLGYHAPQHSSLDHSRSEWKNAVSSELLRFLSSIYSINAISDTRPILEYLHALYIRVGLPLEGSLPQYTGRLVPVCPQQHSDLYDQHPLEKIIHRHYTGSVILPVRDTSIDDDEKLEWRVGHCWTGVTDAWIGLFVKLGCVEAEPMTGLYIGVEGLERLLKEFFDPGLRLYKFTVVSLPNPCLRDIDPN